MQSRSRPTPAFTVMELLVIVGVVLVLVFLAMPNQVRNRIRSKRIQCANNLKLMGLAFKTWPADSTDSYPMVVPRAFGGAKEAVEAGKIASVYQVLSNELVNPLYLRCPSDRERSSAVNFQTLSETNISYFLGVDAVESQPGMFLAGDRNLTNSSGARHGWVYATTNEPIGFDVKLHRFRGNICLADGSVQQVASETLRKLIAETGVGTNRLLLPQGR